jgi:hypothetical protein
MQSARKRYINALQRTLQNKSPIMILCSIFFRKKKYYRTMFLNDTIGIVKIMVRHRVTLSHEKLLGKFFTS